MSARLIAIAIAVLVTAAPSMAQTPERPIGDIEVFATLPYPGHPGGLAVAGRTLYVGDWSAPVIWRVPPGGGQAQPWFDDPRLAGTYGANVAGIALDPSGEELYIAAGTQEGQIAVYRLPLAHPDAAHLEEFHRYT